MQVRKQKSNYAFNPIAEQALGSNQTIVPQRVNAALEFNLKLHRGNRNVQLEWGKNGFVGRRAALALSGRVASRGDDDPRVSGQVGRATVCGRVGLIVLSSNC